MARGKSETTRMNPNVSIEDNSGDKRLSYRFERSKHPVLDGGHMELVVPHDEKELTQEGSAEWTDGSWRNLRWPRCEYFEAAHLIQS